MQWLTVEAGSTSGGQLAVGDVDADGDPDIFASDGYGPDGRNRVEGGGVLLLNGTR